MPKYAIMRIRKLHTSAQVSMALAHHFRTKNVTNADPERLQKNWIWPNIKDGDLANKEYRQAMKKRAMAKWRKELPDKMRKNAVTAVNFMMTYSPGALDEKQSRAYLKDCRDWVQKKYGHVVAMSIHRDETTPHTDVIIVPYDKDGKLNARKLFGGADKMQKMQDEFYEAVGKKYGLTRGIKGSKAKHQVLRAFYSNANKQTENLSELAGKIAEELPRKKLGQSDEQWRDELQTLIRNQLETLQPELIKGYRVEDANRRADESARRANFFAKDSENLKKLLKDPELYTALQEQYKILPQRRTRKAATKSEKDL